MLGWGALIFTTKKSSPPAGSYIPQGIKFDGSVPPLLASHENAFFLSRRTNVLVFRGGLPVLVGGFLFFACTWARFFFAGVDFVGQGAF